MLYHDPGIQRVNESHLSNKDSTLSQICGGHAASLPWWKDATLVNNKVSFFFRPCCRHSIMHYRFNRGLFKASAIMQHIHPLLLWRECSHVCVFFFLFLFYFIIHHGEFRWLSLMWRQSSVDFFLFQGRSVSYHLGVSAKWLSSTLEIHKWICWRTRHVIQTCPPQSSPLWVNIYWKSQLLCCVIHFYWCFMLIHSCVFTCRWRQSKLSSLTNKIVTNVVY